MSHIDLFDLSPLVCPVCGADLGPVLCGCGQPSAHLDPDMPADERAQPQPQLRTPPARCPWCLEDLGSPWCCAGDHPDAHEALTELLAAPVVHLPPGGPQWT